MGWLWTNTVVPGLRPWKNFDFSVLPAESMPKSMFWGGSGKVCICEVYGGVGVVVVSVDSESCCWTPRVFGVFGFVVVGGAGAAVACAVADAVADADAVAPPPLVFMLLDTIPDADAGGC